MKEYEELKSELTEIASIVEKYPDSIRSRVFELLVTSYLGEPLPDSAVQGIEAQPPTATTTPSDTAPASKPQRKVAKKATKTAKKKSGTESYKIDRNLDLTASAESPSFREFHDEKAPSSTAEFNAVTTYYLIKLKGQDSVTLDQAYTCYSEVKKKPADHFKQSFRDTQNKQGYIEFDDDGNVLIPHRGVVFVEHDLPKAQKQ